LLTEEVWTDALQRETITSDFTQAAGALAAVQNDWVVSTDKQPQTVGPKIAIQYATANVMQHNDALGLKASTVRI
jgi:hypothetical protein